VVKRPLAAEADVYFLTGVNCPHTYDETGLSWLDSSIMLYLYRAMSTEYKRCFSSGSRTIEARWGLRWQLN
jgi:hypothetical protein